MDARDDDWLTRKHVCRMLNISLATCKRQEQPGGWLHHAVHKPGGRVVRYLRSAILALMKGDKP